MPKSLAFALLLTTTQWFSTNGLAAEAPASSVAASAPKSIVVRKGASALEAFAANEVRRYVYLRTGKLLPVEQGRGGGDCIVVSRKDAPCCGELGKDLAPQQFILKTGTADGHKVWWVVGGEEVGTLYGAYRFAEKLGMRFGLDEDVVPDEPLSGAWPEPNETGKPRFALRGLQPFHDFSVGPDWWNLEDYQSVLSQMAKLRLNFIGLHTYPSWNPAAGPEANVWIGLPEDVDKDGNVRFGYEAGVVTTRKGWAVKPFPSSQYASGAGLLFEADDYGPDYLLDCLGWPKSEEAATTMFNRYGDSQQKAFSHARRLGIKTCVGTGLPLGIPKALAARLEAKGMKTNDPGVINDLYQGTFLRLMRKMPVDYYWLWTTEAWLGHDPGSKGWEIASEANVERDLGLAQAAATAVNAPFGLATCGWRLGTRADALWTDKHTPKSWAASSINTGLGRDPVEKAYGAMQGRPKWAIAWAEDDNTGGAHCCTCWDLQLWAERMFSNSADAARYGCEGMMAIHWRTAAIAPNITALAEAGWDFDTAANGNSTARSNPALGTDAFGNGKLQMANGKRAAGAAKADMDAFWAEWGRGQFGGDAGAEAGRAIQKLDGSHLGINALVGSAQTTDAQIFAFFAPLRELEALQPRIKGAGSLERLEYWVNLLRATQLRVQTWVLAARLAARVKELNALADADSKLSLTREKVLPLRLNLARSWEHMIAAYVNCARSPGELGTIASIESGNRTRLVLARDADIAKALGQPLPAEAAVSPDYTGIPRIFVSAPRSQMRAGEPQELRAFVLSDEKCTGVTLCWRPLGEGPFKQVRAVHRARQAYRVSVPAQADSAVEYYLEAALADGDKVHWPATAPVVNETASVW